MWQKNFKMEMNGAELLVSSNLWNRCRVKYLIGNYYVPLSDHKFKAVSIFPLKKVHIFALSKTDLANLSINLHNCWVNHLRDSLNSSARVLALVEEYLWMGFVYKRNVDLCLGFDQMPSGYSINKLIELHWIYSYISCIPLSRWSRIYQLSYFCLSYNYFQ